MGSIRFFLFDLDGEGVGVASAPCTVSGAVTLGFMGAAVDGVTINGRLYPVVRGAATVDAEGFGGVASIVAVNSATRKTYICDRVFRAEDTLVPIQQLTPFDVAKTLKVSLDRVSALEEQTEKLVNAVFGLQLFKEKPENKNKEE